MTLHALRLPAPEVLDEVADVLVALAWILAQRLRDDGLQVVARQGLVDCRWQTVPSANTSEAVETGSPRICSGGA